MTPPNFDAVAALDGRLRYTFDLSRPAGARVRTLTYAGSPVRAGQRFAVAIGTARRAGTGGFPHVGTAPVILKPSAAISTLVLDWITDQRVIDAATFAPQNWQVVVGGAPLNVTG